MTPERRQQIDDLLDSALDHESSQRAAFLKNACGGDEVLCREVETLLSLREQSGKVLASPVSEVARGLNQDPVPSPMPLAGRLLGSYQVISLIGRGGMGEVYLARDTKLRREVAIKVLPPVFAQNPERVTRFWREARMLAALSHPNIAAIYGLEEFDRVSYLVLELVPGETLAERLAASRLSQEGALQICAQIAEGLEAAHEKGVIHRDLKPANIKITPEGKVKLLDFGLAKAFEPDSVKDLSDRSTESLGATREGQILGTPAYMSPEQVRGGPLDKRTDIWSYGCVLYEVLTMRQPFGGETVSDTIAALLEREPNWGRLPAMTPASIRLLLRRCLEKDPRRRLHDIADARIEIEDALVAKPELKPRSHGLSWGIKALVALVGAATALLLSYQLLRPAPEGVDGHRYIPFAMEAGVETQPAWSPDGKTLAYAADVSGIRQVLAQGIDAAVPTQLTHSPADCLRPFWSRDGARVFYSMNGKLWSVSAAGGQAELVLEDAWLGSISPDGKCIVFGKGGAGGGLWLYSLADRAESRYPAPLEGVSMTRQVRFSPDGTRVGALWPTQREHTFDNIFWILPYPPGPKARSIRVEASYFSWSPDNRHIVTVENGLSGFGQHLFWVDTETGQKEPLTSGPGNETTVDVSLDGRHIAFTSGTSDGDLVEIPLDGSPLRTLLATSRNEMNPSWSPDGMQYAYVQGTSRQNEIWLRSVHGPWSRPLLRAPDGNKTTTFTNPRFGPDGQRIAFEKWGAEGYTVWVTTIGGGAPVRLVGERDHQHHPAWSPDGAWIAYRANVGDERIIEKVPSGGGRPLLVTKVRSALNVLWSPTGEWLGYEDGDGVYIVSANGGQPRRLLDQRSGSIAFNRDGSKLFVVLRESTKWQLWSVAISTGERRRERALEVPASAMVQGLALHPDGNRLTTSIVTAREDIWILGEFVRPGRRWSDLRFWDRN